MANKRLLLLSNSTNYGERYLEYPSSAIKDFLGGEPRTILFVPFAGVRSSFSEYAATVRERFREMGYRLESVHEASDPREAVGRAEAIAVGGGNTFHLLRGLYEAGLVEAIRSRVAEDGVPFIGWSAGSNVACPTIKTTNDMPIVEPPTLSALNLVPFQINPHYTDEGLSGHAGETREQRLSEFIEVNEGVYVVGLREGSILRVEGSSIRLIGEKSARVFIKGKEAMEIAPQDSLQFLLETAGH
ncbi:MAG TPA: dipeptidase PepE [Pyrinomonadaceae bacterium]|jgi:dipeptidase E|nr:dipeptidase PepE [Pyrinomonadaceae bacterium]